MTAQDHGVVPRRTPRPWPEYAEPTAEQLADWLLVCGPEERLRFARHALVTSRDSMRCMLEHGPMAMADQADRETARGYCTNNQALGPAQHDRCDGTSPLGKRCGCSCHPRPTPTTQEA